MTFKLSSTFYKVVCLIFLCAMLIVLGLISLSAPTKDKKAQINDRPKLDGRVYYEGVLLESFLQASINRSYKYTQYFPQFTPNPDNRTFPNKLSIYDPERVKAIYPWLYHLLYPKEPLENWGLINKWKKPINIAFSYPSYPFWEGGYIYSKDKITSIEESPYNWARTQINTLIPELTSATGLEINFPEPQSLGNDGNLRIVILNDKFGETEFRVGQYIRWTWPAEHIPNFEERMPNKIDFTPKQLYQIEGYFVPSNDHEIQFAACRVWKGHPEQLFKTMIRECLLRSLGFPETQMQWGNSLLYPWNHMSFKRSVSDNFITHEGLNQFDTKMLKTLYSNKVKTGDSHLKILKKLDGDLTAP